MCDVMIGSRVRSRVVRSWSPWPGRSSLKEIEAMKGVQWEKRAKMIEDCNIIPPLKESRPCDLTPPSWFGSIRVPQMKFLDQLLGMFHMECRFPGVFRDVIASPMDQVL